MYTPLNTTHNFHGMLFTVTNAYNSFMGVLLGLCG